MASQFRFGPFRVDTESGALFLSGAKVAIQRQPFALLALLLERPGAVVTRDELRARIWPEGTFVDFERALNTTVRKLRRALRDSAARPRFVETVPQQGYRFVAPVEDVGDGPSESTPADAVSASLSVTLAEVAATAILQHRLFSDAVESHGGRMARGSSDGFAARFESTLEALRAAIALEQAAHLLERDGSPLRIGVTSDEEPLAPGESRAEQAKGLSRRAAPGQILCSASVARVVAGREAFRLRTVDAGGVCELLSDPDRASALLARAPFVGRERELARLASLLAEADAGSGRVAFVAGEPGIGKTSLLQEFGLRARGAGAQVYRGAAREGEFGRPFGPFAEALSAWAADAEAEALGGALGRHATVVARIVPELFEKLPDLAEPERLAPDEERVRALDAVSQVIWSLSRHKTLVLMLDDLHWADAGSLAMLRHVAPFLARYRVLLVGAYRDIEVDRRHTLHDVMASLARDGRHERIDLRGLDGDELRQLVAAVSPGEPSKTLLATLERDTQGNPFFVREILLSMFEEGRLGGAPGKDPLVADVAPRISANVRQVVHGRLARLSDAAHRLVGAASACERGFDFQAVTAAADLDEGTALDALDETLDAQIVRATAKTDRYEFGHALIRQTVYEDLSPSRRLRLHRRLAEALADQSRGDEHAFEIARHFQCSAALPGAERGADHALVAAERAERAAAFDEAAAALRVARELLPECDARRARVAARLGLALLLGSDRDTGVRAATEAARELAASEGDAAAAEYLAAAATPLQMWSGRGQELAWRIAQEGIRYAGDRRDLAWAVLMLTDLERREAEDPENPGTMIDSVDRRAAWSIVTRASSDARAAIGRPRTRMIHERWALIESRASALTDWKDDYVVTGHWAGDYVRAIALCDRYDAAARGRGHLPELAATLVFKARFQLALGEIEAGRRTLADACEVGERAGISRDMVARLFVFELLFVRREASAPLAARIEQEVANSGPGGRWLFGPLHASAALIHAAIGNVDAALERLAAVLPAIERSPKGALINLPMTCFAARALWELDRREHADAIERNLRTKVLAGDLRAPQVDVRLALAQLCALTRRHAESSEWFARARSVLEEQGARPLRAVVDYDEALALRRRDARGDRARAQHLLRAAREQFEAIDMPGWLRSADLLARELA